MPLSICFDQDAWDQYVYWQGQDRRILKRINILIRDCQRDPFHGIGKPESLKRELSGYWSRRIDDSHRLIYRVTHAELQIIACRYHYST
ncbi:MAG TPA: Txe/YoeB family addiction module toxin [Rhodanobacteraceae bacterium]|nr:Txe/YoeB family addiction module toxin [Rhodanobacteraceae bacterium]